LGGVESFGSEIQKKINEVSSGIMSANISIGFYMTNTVDTTRTNLYDPGQLAIIYGKYRFSIMDKAWVDMDIATTTGPNTDWSFTRLNTVISFDYEKDNMGIRNRSIMGHIIHNNGVPAQERYTIEGAGSGDLYAKPYLRDKSSFYGNIDLRNHYHLSGDANFRGYFGEDLVGTESVISNTFEIFFKPTLNVIGLELAAFLDDGWIWGSKYLPGDEGFNGEYLFDAGVGLRLHKSILGRKFYLRLDAPFFVKDISKNREGVRFLNDKWLFSFSKSI